MRYTASPTKSLLPPPPSSHSGIAHARIYQTWHHLAKTGEEEIRRESQTERLLVTTDHVRRAVHLCSSTTRQRGIVDAGTC